MLIKTNKSSELSITIKEGKIDFTKKTSIHLPHSEDERYLGGNKPGSKENNLV